MKIGFRARRLAEGVGGYCDHENELIIVSNRNDNKTIVCSFFHEICHILMRRQGRWKSYHLSTCDKKGYRFALRAERAVDKMAKKLMKIYFPRIKYESGYDEKNASEWLREYYRVN